MTVGRKARREPAKTQTPAQDKDAAGDNFIGPSTDPATNLLLANLALTGGVELVRRGLEHGLLGKTYAPDKARKLLKSRSLMQSLAGAALTRIAMRSVPGAILVGGGLLAKTLYDRRKGKAALPDPASSSPASDDGLADDPDTGGQDSRGY